MEILNILFIIFITIIAGWFAWETSVMVSEKKARYRAGTHDHYDNLIEEEPDDIEEGMGVPLSSTTIYVHITYNIKH